MASRPALSEPGMPPALPIDPLLPEIVSVLKRSQSLVIIAPPGAGKTTRVPPALLRAQLAGSKEIAILQPRRLPTRLAARRVAEEMGEPLGGLVGYQVRFEEVTGPRTRLRFVTEGVLERKLFSNPRIPEIGLVVLDEFHERHLSGDLCLALLRDLQQRERPDLKLVVMSATLDAEPIAAYLGNCQILRSEGRQFEIDLQHLPAPDPRSIEEQVLASLKRLGAQNEGDALVFLPGAAEIRRTREACLDFAKRHHLELHALHGDLPAEEQDRAVRPSTRRKLILSTNVAETSVTIEGITAVIDSGLARISSHSPWSGLPMLKLSKVSKASAIQRAGRAGRTRPGMCLRLYTRQDFETRPDHETPEIQRLDLASAVLGLHSLGVRDLRQFPFFEAPPDAAVEAAQALLQRLGAASPAGELTPLGRRLLELPLHPRLGILILDGERRGISSEAILVAALLGERDIRQSSRARIATSHSQHAAAASSPSDLLELLESFQEAERQRFDPRRLRDLGLDPNVVRSVDRVRKQLGRNLSSKAASSSDKVEEALLRCALAAFPDRVAKRRSATSNELLLGEGGTAFLDPASAVTDELLVAVDAEERMSSQGARTWVRLASKVEPEWLLDLPHNEIQESDRLEWNPATERVETVARMAYGKIILEETRRIAPPSAQSAELLYKMASAEQGKLFDLETIAEWKERLALLSSAFPSAGFPPPGRDRWDGALRELCRQASSYDELRTVNPVAALGSLLTPEQSRLMATHAPERIALPGGRQLKVHYEAGKPPWVESRLQDFFGLKEGPRIGGGRLPLVLHLLAPNHRPVQVTSDLSGFWERHYPSIRRELARKYPRHAWPENPLQALPPGPRARR